MDTTTRQLELVPTEELRGQLTIAGALEDHAQLAAELRATAATLDPCDNLRTTMHNVAAKLAPALAVTYRLAASATGRRHGMADANPQAAALCGSLQTMAAGSACSLEQLAVALNDAHLDGTWPVCHTCRAKASVAVLTGAEL